MASERQIKYVQGALVIGAILVCIAAYLTRNTDNSRWVMILIMPLGIASLVLAFLRRRGRLDGKFYWTALAVSVLVVWVIVMFVMASTEAHPVPSPSPSPAAALDFGKIPGEFPVGEPVAAGAQLAPVGACVSLQGAPPEPSLSVVDCGSPNNGFKVVQRVSTPAECTSDVDQRFYMNPEGGQFTACLDYAWSTKDCLSISKYTATRVACDAAGAGDREKPVNVITDATSIAGCPTGGFAHAVRRFTICTQTMH